TLTFQQLGEIVRVDGPGPSELLHPAGLELEELQVLGFGLSIIASTTRRIGELAQHCDMSRRTFGSSLRVKRHCLARGFPSFRGLAHLSERDGKSEKTGGERVGGKVGKRASD